MKLVRLISLPLAGIATVALLSGCGDNANPLAAGQGLDTTPPPAPASVSFSHDELGRTTLVWSESAAADVIGYQVYVYSPSPDRDNAYVLASGGDVAGNAYLIPGVIAHTDATYRVRAVDAAGNKSAYSQSASWLLSPAGGAGGQGPIDVE